MKPSFLQFRKQWKEHAETLRQPLHSWIVAPRQLVTLQNDATAWQGVSAIAAGPVPPLLEMAVHDTVILDFGEHLVGEVEFDISCVGHDFDAPVLLRVLAAETPYELTYRPEKYTGALGMGWMQEDVLRIISATRSYRMPNRLAMQYLRLEILAAPGKHVAISGMKLHAQSAVGRDLPAPPANLSPLGQSIHQAGCRTLRNCMQGILEDGPKRDRRLWLGDLRLQALANAATYRQKSLVERSIYLLAADTDDEGHVASCAYENAANGHGCQIMEYPLLLAPVLLEHFRAYGNRELAEEFFDLAAWQFHLARPLIGTDGLLHHDGSRWLVVDHSQELEKDTAFQGIYLFGLEALANLGESLGKSVESCRAEAARLRQSLLRQRFDSTTGLFFSGESHQFSAASQIWAVLGGVVSGQNARELLERMTAFQGLVPVFSPYMQHYMLEACQYCGATALQQEVIRDYWGKMIETGASTFYEIFNPLDQFYSPYDDAMANSACHAWSCTPVLYLR